MATIIGRKSAIEDIIRSINSDKSEFIAVYGRRRVGKTFLIRNMFEGQFTLTFSGVSRSNTKTQIASFNAKLRQHPFGGESLSDANTWMVAFENLREILNKDSRKTKIIFIDELPWLDTKNSGFMAALEYFWNEWAGARGDIKLIVCGSAASWMIENLIKNKAGLYNRVTNKIKLNPFTLHEVKLYLKEKGCSYDDYQIILIYMVFGGIPYYLDYIEKTKSATQNINNLLFGENAKLSEEYEILLASLFNKYEKHTAIINAIATKKKGLFKNDIIKLTKIKDGGTLTKALNELEASDFIRKYTLPGKNSRDAVYQLIDNYTLFYNTYLTTNEKLDSNFWVNNLNSPQYNSWAGNAFEIVGLNHVSQIKKALGISGIQSNDYAWANEKTQIDLIVDRKDNVVNVIEFKFSTTKYKITPDYAQKLNNKLTEIRNYLKTNKSVWLIMLTMHGLASMNNAEIVHQNLSAEVLFEN